MGMFDYVTHEGKEYQSKDTPDQYLSTYRIVNGRLLGDEWHMVEVPKAERPHPNEDGLMGLIGSVRRIVDKADVDQNWHGYLWLTAGKEEGYASYRAKFTDGTLVEFERVSDSATPVISTEGE